MQSSQANLVGRSGVRPAMPQREASEHDMALNGSVNASLSEGSHQFQEFHEEKHHVLKIPGRSVFEKSLSRGLRRMRGAGGGRGGVGMDGVIIDLTTRTFVPLMAKGSPPPARSHAVVALVGNMCWCVCPPLFF